MKKITSTACFLALFGTADADTVGIGIGHQSTVTNTVSGGIVLEKLGLVEKHLPDDLDYELVYRDYDSGPPITNHMLAGNLQFGVMGDYPLIVNGANFQETGSRETRFIAVTGYNAQGTGNGVVVPTDSPAQTLEDLAGKEISTPEGSAAWGMLLDALSERDMLDGVSIRNQSPAVGLTNIARGMIDGHANFTPWSEVMEFRGTGRRIFEGSEVGVPTFHGIVVRKDFAEDYPEVVQAVVDATLEAQEWIQEDPKRAATKISDWTGIEAEVLYLYFSEGGITTVDASLKPELVDALQYHYDTLDREIGIPDLDFERWVDDQFVREAYERMGQDYQEQIDTLVESSGDESYVGTGEIWYADEGIVSYDSVAEMLAAREEAQDNGSEIRVTYVYDHESGLKLFGQAAYYVEDADGDVTAFMRKPDAESYAESNGGELLTVAAAAE